MGVLGRPSLYTEELGNKICTLILSGESVSDIARREDMPCRSTIMLWITDNKNGFSDKYAKAIAGRAHTLVEDLIDIADNIAGQPVIVDGTPLLDEDGKPIMRIDNVSVNHARLKLDARKWIASKLLPKYSDSQQSEGAEDISAALLAIAGKLPGA